jgi:hydrogenase/urease accessory protein HupE
MKAPFSPDAMVAAVVVLGITLALASAWNLSLLTLALSLMSASEV